ncbi:hypothetical protein JCM8097_009504 [Rhodosporidiobolus ruineniae]
MSAVPASACAVLDDALALPSPHVAPFALNYLGLLSSDTRQRWVMQSHQPAPILTQRPRVGGDGSLSQPTWKPTVEEVEQMPPGELVVVSAARWPQLCIHALWRDAKARDAGQPLPPPWPATSLSALSLPDLGADLPLSSSTSYAAEAEARRRLLGVYERPWQFMGLGRGRGNFAFAEEDASDCVTDGLLLAGADGPGGAFAIRTAAVLSDRDFQDLSRLAGQKFVVPSTIRIPSNVGASSASPRTASAEGTKLMKVGKEWLLPPFGFGTQGVVPGRADADDAEGEEDPELADIDLQKWSLVFWQMIAQLRRLQSDLQEQGRSLSQAQLVPVVLTNCASYAFIWLYDCKLFLSNVFTAAHDPFIAYVNAVALAGLPNVLPDLAGLSPANLDEMLVARQRARKEIQTPNAPLSAPPTTTSRVPATAPLGAPAVGQENEEEEDLAEAEEERRMKRELSASADEPASKRTSRRDPSDDDPPATSTSALASHTLPPTPSTSSSHPPNSKPATSAAPSAAARARASIAGQAGIELSLDGVTRRWECVRAPPTERTSDPPAVSGPKVDEGAGAPDADNSFSSGSAAPSADHLFDPNRQPLSSSRSTPPPPGPSPEVADPPNSAAPSRTTFTFKHYASRTYYSAQLDAYLKVADEPDDEDDETEDCDQGVDGLENEEATLRYLSEKGGRGWLYPELLGLYRSPFGRYGLLTAAVGKPMTREELKRIDDPINAVKTLHRLGVAHGDVHEDNIVINNRGGVGFVDFAQSSILDEIDADLAGLDQRTDLLRFRRLLEADEA